jgi:hypothetical protein
MDLTDLTNCIIAFYIFSAGVLIGIFVGGTLEK